MKGYKVDIKTGKIEFVDDGLPSEKRASFAEPKMLDLEKVNDFLARIDIKKLEALLKYAEGKGWV